MTLTPSALRARLVADASAPYRAAGRFAYHFARGKLDRDPVFLDLLRLGPFPVDARILDLGCGQGLLAAWLLSARRLYDAGDWPAGWPAPPRIADVRGIDVSREHVTRARLALDRPARFEEGDMRVSDFERANVVVLLDVMHYIDRPAQDDMLRRIRAALRPDGLFLTRVGDAGAGMRFRLSNWVDRIVAAFRGNGLLRLHCRPVSDWTRALEVLGFRVQAAPIDGQFASANVVLIAHLVETSGPDLVAAPGQIGSSIP